MVKGIRADQVIIDDVLVDDETFSGLTPYEERKQTQRARRMEVKERQLDRKQKRSNKRMWV